MQNNQPSEISNTDTNITQTTNNSDCTNNQSNSNEIAPSSRTKKLTFRNNLRFDIDYNENYKSFTKRSKSTRSAKTQYNSTLNFASVKEENNEDDQTQKFTIPKLKRFFMEMHDNLEDSLFMSASKKKDSKASSKCLSLMDPVVEAKEEVDFDPIRSASFYEKVEPYDIPMHHLHYSKAYTIEDPIVEDKMENEFEPIEIKKKAISFMKISSTDFYDKTEMIENPQTQGNIITDSIKEFPDDENEPEYKFKTVPCKTS